MWQAEHAASAFTSLGRRLLQRGTGRFAASAVEGLGVEGTGADSQATILEPPVAPNTRLHPDTVWSLARKSGCSLETHARTAPSCLGNSHMSPGPTNARHCPPPSCFKLKRRFYWPRTPGPALHRTLGCRKLRESGLSSVCYGDPPAGTPSGCAVRVDACQGRFQFRLCFSGTTFSKTSTKGLLSALQQDTNPAATGPSTPSQPTHKWVISTSTRRRPPTQAPLPHRS